MTKTVHVLFHAYPDSSGARVVRVYANRERGEQDMELLDEPEIQATGWTLAEMTVIE